MYDGYVFKYDLSIPIKKFYSIVEEMEKRLGNDAIRISGYGHIGKKIHIIIIINLFICICISLGDSNIHLNITFKEFSQEALKKVEPFVYEYTSSLKGSISAEHGVGFRKPKYIHYSKTEPAIKLMRDIKRIMDPNGILNPYKVLP